MGYEQAIDRLAQEIRELRIEFERFFAGDLPAPPEGLRAQILAHLRELRNANLQSAIDNFRLGSVEAQFNAYNELFNRRLREREEGRARLPPPPPAVHLDPGSGVVVGAAPDAAAVEALFQRLYGRGSRAAKVDLETFRAYLSSQVASIRGKTGCAAVQFRVTEEEGKLKLKAKPVAGEPGVAPASADPAAPADRRGRSAGR
jgi:hypothetical protein